MLTPLQHDYINEIICNDLSSIVYYSLRAECPAEHRTSIRNYLAILCESENLSQAIANIPAGLPVAIKGFLRLTAEKYHTENIPSIFFVEQKYKAAVQIIFQELLASTAYYLHDDKFLKPPAATKSVDTLVKQVLRPDSIAVQARARKQKPHTPTLDDALKTAENGLEKNQPVHGILKQPVHALQSMTKLYENAPNDRRRIALKQRLKLLDFMTTFLLFSERDFLNATYDEGIDLPRQNNNYDERIELPRQDITSFSILLAGGLILAGFFTYAYLDNNTRAAPRSRDIQMPGSRPFWPSGITELGHADSLLFRHLATRGGLHSFEGVVSPFADYRIDYSNHPALFQIVPTIDLGKMHAQFDNFDTSLRLATAEIAELLSEQDVNFMQAYSYIWAFLAEHGRQTGLASTLGGRFYFSNEQQLHLRAIEALRAGLEAVVKSRLPSYFTIDAGQHIHPEKLLYGLEQLTFEAEAIHENMQEDKFCILKRWLDLLDHNKIDYVWPENLDANTLTTAYQQGAKQSSIVSARDRMSKSMQEKPCPWWQKPQAYIGVGLGSAKDLVCNAWVATATQGTQPASTAKLTKSNIQPGSREYTLETSLEIRLDEARLHKNAVTRARTIASNKNAQENLKSVIAELYIYLFATDNPSLSRSSAFLESYLALREHKILVHSASLQTNKKEQYALRSLNSLALGMRTLMSMRFSGDERTQQSLAAANKLNAKGHSSLDLWLEAMNIVCIRQEVDPRCPDPYLGVEKNHANLRQAQADFRSLFAEWIDEVFDNNIISHGLRKRQTSIIASYKNTSINIATSAMHEAMKSENCGFMYKRIAGLENDEHYGNTAKLVCDMWKATVQHKESGQREDWQPGQNPGW